MTKKMRMYLMGSEMRVKVRGEMEFSSPKIERMGKRTVVEGREKILDSI